MVEMMVQREEQKMEGEGSEGEELLERLFIVTVRMAVSEERKRADRVIEVKSLE